MRALYSGTQDFFHPNLPPRTLHSITAKTRAAEQSTNEREKIPESESSVCRCVFSAFLDHRVRACSFETYAWHRRWTTHTQSTHTHTHVKQLSVTQLSSDTQNEQPLRQT